jgi:hypothetical protein
MVLWSAEVVSDSTETTKIIGEFRGCETGRVYPLANGKVLVCRSFFYHRDDAPEVRIIDEHTASIGGETYKVSIENVPDIKPTESDRFSGCFSEDDATSSVESSPDKCAVFRSKRTAARRYWPEAYEVFEDGR